MKTALVGRFFGYRDYFHGLGDERDQTAIRKPIREPHRSNVFLSQPANILSVAFSVPVFDKANPNEPLGVLAMEADLGHFAEFVGARNQFASIVDLRPDETGKRGLIAEHPRLYQQQGEFHRRYVGEPALDELERVRVLHEKATQGKNAADADSPNEDEDGLFAAYRDPLLPQDGDNWLCAADPVFVTRGKGGKYDSGWAILVQEKRTEVLAPLQGLWRFMIVGGLMALGLVVLILTVLWGYVLIRLRAGDGMARFLRRLARLPETPSQTLSARTEGTSALSERTEERLTGATHG